MNSLYKSLTDFMGWVVEVTDTPLVVTLIGGGLFLTLFSGFRPLTKFVHALKVLSGRYDREHDPGQLSHFQALSTALAATIGVGNIGGVAAAISTGGAGAVFWMWIAAAVGMTTKFFACSLSQLYRKQNENGEMIGGPMYTIELGMGRRWKPLAIMFCVFGTIGCLPMYQTNQLAEILKSELSVEPMMTAVVITVLVAIVAFGGVVRIGRLTSALVPSMCFLYLLLSAAVIALRIDLVPAVLTQIVSEAFSFSAGAGGATGVAVAKVIQVGVRRAAFSNEAGVGTAPLAHGVAKTTEPIREGLVAMVGPFIDTLVVCTLTAIVILLADLETTGELKGVSLTAAAFASVLGPWAAYALVLLVALFAFSTMVGYSFYGRQCFTYLVGPRLSRIYTVIYLGGLFFGGVVKPSLVLNTIDVAFVMMAIPNMIATVYLAPKVISAARDYFQRLEAGEFDA